jgi:hypothetical protein
VLTSAVRSGLRDALEDQVGKIEAQLDRILITERDGDVADFTDAFGKNRPWIGTGLRTIRPCFQDDHGIAAVGHDEVQTIEREVWGYQRTVNLGRVVAPSTDAITGLRDGLGLSSLTRGDDPIDVNRGDARGLPSANDYTRSRRGCNVDVVGRVSTTIMQWATYPNPALT